MTHLVEFKFLARRELWKRMNYDSDDKISYLKTDMWEWPHFSSTFAHFPFPFLAVKP